MNELEIHHLATIITDSNKNNQWMQKLTGGSLNNKACWGTIHLESLMLLHVLQAGTLPLFWSLFWRIFVYWTALEVEIVFSSWAKGRLFNVQYDKDNDSLLGKCQAGLLAPYIRFQFPKPGFLSYNDSFCVGVTWSCSHNLMGTELGNQANTDRQATAITMSKKVPYLWPPQKKSFISYLLPASMANLLSCKTLQFLTFTQLQSTSPYSMY